MILVIDNYDSFTYNLVDLAKRFTEVVVFRNDEIDLDQVSLMAPQGILISPGPGRPEHSGVSYDIVTHYHQQIPMLGVCLGHQIICELFGGEVIYAKQPMHGKSSIIYHSGNSLFYGVQNPLEVMRYHSLLVKKEGLPDDFRVIAQTKAGEVMAVEHKFFKLTGVQFHPESILTQDGEQMMQNWLQIICS